MSLEIVERGDYLGKKQRNIICLEIVDN